MDCRRAYVERPNVIECSEVIAAQWRCCSTGLHQPTEADHRVIEHRRYALKNPPSQFALFKSN